MYYLQDQYTEQFLSGETKGHGFFDWSEDREKAVSRHTVDELLHFLIDEPVAHAIKGKHLRIVFVDGGKHRPVT